MLRSRPYKHEDAKTILSWSKDARAFYRKNVKNKQDQEKIDLIRQAREDRE